MVRLEQMFFSLLVLNIRSVYSLGITRVGKTLGGGGGGVQEVIEYRGRLEAAVHSLEREQMWPVRPSSLFFYQTGRNLKPTTV